MKVKGHRLTVRSSGEDGVERSWTGECACGRWEESGHSRAVVRFEYRYHLIKVASWNEVQAATRVAEP